MIERQLNAEESKLIKALIDDRKLEPFKEEVYRKSGELYYDVDGMQYRLVFTPDFDWFCDIVYEGEYDTNS